MAQPGHPKVRVGRWVGGGSELHLLGTCGQPLPFSPRAPQVGKGPRRTPVTFGSGGGRLWLVHGAAPGTSLLGPLQKERHHGHRGWRGCVSSTGHSAPVMALTEGPAPTPQRPSTVPEITPLCTLSPHSLTSQGRGGSSLHTRAHWRTPPARHDGPGEKGALSQTADPLQLQTNNSVPGIADWLTVP